MIKRKCINCDWARHIALANLNKGLVCCGHFTINRDDKELNTLCEAWEGWAWLKRRPYTLQSNGIGDGIMTNYSVMVKQDDCCRYFEPARQDVIQSIQERKRLAELSTINKEGPEDNE